MAVSIDELVVIGMPREIWDVIDHSLDDACQPLAEVGGDDPDVDEARRSGGIDVERTVAGRARLVITKLPVQLDPSRVLEQIADQVRDGALTGIADLSDDSADTQTRLLITLRTNADPDVVLNDVSTAVSHAQREARELAMQIRESAGSQAEPVGDRHVTDGSVTIGLSRTQWEYLWGEIERHTPNEKSESSHPLSMTLGRRAVEMIDSGLYGEALEAEPVSTGRSASGLDWTITLSGRRDTPSVALAVSRHGQSMGTGGIELSGHDSAMNVMTSHYDELPTLVMAVVDATIDRVVVTTTQGIEFEIALSAPDTQLGKRFGAGSLPDGQDIGSMHAETAGVIVERRPEQGTYPRRNRPIRLKRGPNEDGQGGWLYHYRPTSGEDDDPPAI